MRVLLYTGNLKTVEKSGIGKAVEHQREALSYAKIPYTTDENEDYDVVHLNTLFPDSYFMGLRARRGGKKVIYYGHSTVEDFRNSFKGSNQIAPVFRWWLKRCYSVGDLIITPTDYSKGLLESYGIRKPVAALTNGINLELYHKKPDGGRAFRKKYQISDEEKVVICAGHYMKRKGILDFVEIAERMPYYRFIWFGYTDEKLTPREVREAVKKELPNLMFPGYVGSGEMMDAYSGGDLFFFPTYEETEGIVLLEALAMKIPVLVRDIPIYKKWLREGESVYKGRSNEEFEWMITSILEKKAPDLTERGYRLVADNSIPSVSKKLCGLYRFLGVLEE